MKKKKCDCHTEIKKILEDRRYYMEMVKCPKCKKQRKIVAHVKFFN